MLRFLAMLNPIAYDPGLIERLCGAEAAVYAARKQRGGASGQKGVSFEVAYAAYRIALAARHACLEAPTAKDVWFQSQTGGFIDDLAVSTLDKMTLSQAKSGAAAWAGGDHKLADDFRLQRQLDAASDIRVTYELVVSSDDQASALAGTSPDDLTDVTVTAFRCTGQDWQGLLAAHPELEEALDAISHQPQRRIVREQTFQAIAGLWLHRGCRGSLLDLMATLAERPDALVRAPGPTYELRADVVDALGRVANLAWSIDGRHFLYVVGGLITGRAAFPCGSTMFLDFERFMVDQRPTDWKDVVRELRRESPDAR